MKQRKEPDWREYERRKKVVEQTAKTQKEYDERMRKIREDMGI